MFLYVLLVGFVVGATASDVGDAIKCTEGPKFWCANLKNAKSCQALDHCIQAVWAVQAYPKDDDVTCKICEGLVTEARQYLAKGDTQDSIEKVIADGCKKVPIATVASECTTLVQDYLPEIMQLLTAETDPLTVCTAMRLCNNRRIDMISHDQETKPVHDIHVEISPVETAEITFNECDVCQMKMGNLARDFKKAPDQIVMDRMFLVCGELGTYSTACSTYVSTHFDKIRDFLESRMKPVEMCQLTNRCMQPVGKRLTSGDMEKDDWCGLCTETLDQWKSVLVLNSTEQDFKELLLDLCTEVGFLVDQCRDVVDQYYVPLYDWLLHEFQPKVICQDVGFCPGKELDSVNVWPVVPAGTGDMLKSREASVLNPQIIDKGGLTKDGPLEEDAVWFKEQPHLVHITLQTPGLSISPQIKPLSEPEILPPLPLERMTGAMDAAAAFDAAGSESCAICQTVMHEVENLLTDSQTVDEIKSVIDNICDKLPTAIDTECRGFVDRYGAFILALLAQKFDPASICPKLKLCPEGLDVKIVSLAGAEYPKTVAYDLAEVKKPETQKSTESVTCVVCEYAVGIVQQALNDNATQDEIREALDSLCDRLPDAVAGECELLVNAYSEEIIDAMILDLTPEQTCRYLMLCKPPKSLATPTAEATDMEKFLDFDVLPDDLDKKPKQDKKKTKVEASPGCILCEFVMSRLEEMLKDNTTDKNIEDDLRKVCRVMPKSVRADCNNFVDQYFKIILDTLEHLPPSEVCGAVALCSSHHITKEKPYKVKGSFKCTVCKDLMKLLKEVLMDERIDHKIADDFEKLCGYLPKSVGKKYRSQCYDVMEHYGPYVVNMLATLEKPEELCSYIDMCEPIPGLVKIDPSSEHCDLGPKYFCAKKKRAQLCEKVDYCNEHIWKKEGKKMKKSKRWAKTPKK